VTDSCSQLTERYQAPPGLMNMVEGMRASGAGVVVCIFFLPSSMARCLQSIEVSCSDPRLNPYQILGIDLTLS
jgi:carbonic anhydrase